MVNATPKSRRNGYTYADAGVDIKAGNDLVDSIKALAASTKRPGADASLGGFGGVFDLKALGMSDPLLIAATDGVGTKLRLAIDHKRHDTIGIDLVAMCVNDLIVQGAAPLFFLDYLATGKLDQATAHSIVAGIAEGCRQAGCALIGGETAEMPGHYAGEDYDLAGFSVGAVERPRLLPNTDQIQPGDVLIALPSSGIHSNGYSLVRKIIDDLNIDVSARTEFDEQPLIETLLTPTKIYVKALKPLMDQSLIKAAAHITGGGFTENIPRILPKGLDARVDLATVKPPPVFAWLAHQGGIEEAEMLKTFNCGIGMVLVVASEQADDVIAQLAEANEPSYLIGEVASNETEEEARTSYTGRLGLGLTSHD